MKKLAILIVALTIATVGYGQKTLMTAQTAQTTHQTEDQLRKQIENDRIKALADAEAQKRSRQYHQTAIERPKSTSGLDKKKQKTELTDTLLYMYGNEVMIDFIRSQLDKTELSNSKRQCLNQKINSQNFKQFIAKQAGDYVDKHTAEKIADDLKLLINSGFSDEVHELFKGKIEAKNADEEKMAFNTFKLHLMQRQDFALAMQKLSNDPNYADFKKLVFFNDESPYFTEFVNNIGGACLVVR